MIDFSKFKSAFDKLFSTGSRPSPAICALDSPMMKIYAREEAEQLERAGELKGKLDIIQRTCDTLEGLQAQFGDLEFVFKSLVNENDRRRRRVPFKDDRTRSALDKFFYNERPHPGMCAPDSPAMQQYEREAIESLESKGVDVTLGEVKKTCELLIKLLEWSGGLGDDLNTLLSQNRRVIAVSSGAEQEEPKECEKKDEKDADAA